MFKESLMEALGDAVREYNSTRDADSAIIKAAEAHNFNPDQAQRLVELFNTAHAVSHYKTAADKTGQFKLASMTNVISALFDPSKMEPLMPAKQAALALHSYQEYNVPEFATYTIGGWGHCRPLPGAFIKNAQAMSKPEPLRDVKLNSWLVTAYGKLDAMKRANAEIAHAKAIGEIEYGRMLDKMAGMLRRNYPDLAGEILSMLTKYAVAEYGEEGGYAVADMAAELPDYKISIKTAGLADAEDVAPYIPMLDMAVKLRTELVGLDKLAEEMGQEVKGFEQGMKDALSPFGYSGPTEKSAQTPTPAPRPYVLQEPPQLPAPGSPDYDSIYQQHLEYARYQQQERANRQRQETEQAKLLTGQGGKPPSAPKPLGSKPDKGKSLLMENMVSPWMKAIPDVLAKSYDDKVNAQAASLKEKSEMLQRQEVLTDLLSNDPVLSSEDPHKVARIYEAIWNMAPALTRQKEVMRSILRAASQTIATDAYDALTWTQLEKNLQQMVAGQVGKEEQQPQAKR